MAKTKKPLRSVRFDLDNKKQGDLPSVQEVDSSLQKLLGEEGEAQVKKTRLPLTTAVLPEHRAALEAIARERKCKLADVLERALQDYLQAHPVQDQKLLESLLNIYKQA